MTATAAPTAQTYHLFIRATPRQLWDAIAKLEHAPRTAERVAGTGWMRVLSGLKTLLETGRPVNP